MLNPDVVTHFKDKVDRSRLPSIPNWSHACDARGLHVFLTLQSTWLLTCVNLHVNQRGVHTIISSPHPMTAKKAVPETTYTYSGFCLYSNFRNSCPYIFIIACINFITENTIYNYRKIMDQAASISISSSRRIFLAKNCLEWCQFICIFLFLATPTNGV